MVHTVTFKLLVLEDQVMAKVKHICILLVLKAVPPIMVKWTSLGVVIILCHIVVKVVVHIQRVVVVVLT